MSGSTLPTIMTPSGLQPQTPAALNAQLIAMAQALSPGLTILPAGLIEDLSSTGTGALLVMDQARVDVINSVTPLGANPFILYQQGQMVGVAQGQDTNASVYLVFSLASPGFVIPIGFTASDGTNQYAVQDGGVIGSGGQSEPLFAIATNPGTFAIPAGTVTQLVTSVPSGYALTVTNPLAGTPAGPAQTISDYRSQVLQAWYVTSTGTAPFLRTLLGNVPGVNQNLISVRNIPSVGWEIIVGGSGDPYQIAGAIFQAMPDLSLIVGSTLAVSNITAASNGVVTTTLNHGYATGQAVRIAGVVPSGYDQTYFSITVLTETTFETNINTAGYGAYVSGGVCTPNFRNETVTINNYPDSYSITFVIPPAQTVAMAVSWNTVSVNYVSASSVAQLASAALASYVNALPIGVPMNVDVMISTFTTAIAAILPAQLLSTVTFSVTINSIATSPSAGTVLIYGDPESYFTTTAAAIVVTQI